jgi:uncharacterized membrane protein YecN with MAPEG domain
MTMSVSLAVTPYYVAFNAALLLWLAVGVARQRIAAKVSLGDGGVPALQRAIRVHGNAVEYVPITLILLVCLELAGAAAPWLHGLGVALSLARVLHAYGLGKSSGLSFGRYWGIAATWATIGTAILLLLVQVAGRM